MIERYAYLRIIFLEENMKIGNSDYFWRGNLMAFNEPGESAKGRDLLFTIHL